MPSQLTYLTFDKDDSECLRVKDMLDRRGILFIRIPCRGIIEPTLYHEGKSYRGIEHIARLLRAPEEGKEAAPQP